MAPDLRAVLAPHVPLKLVDWRCLGSLHDVEGNGLMPVAAKATDFEVAVPGVDRIAPVSATAAPNPESQV
jgi:hypothetical protein